MSAPTSTAPTSTAPPATGAPELDSLLEIARTVVAIAAELGAEEALAGVGRSVSTELTRRDGRIEKAEESRSLGLSASLMVDGRYSAHATSDLRPEALREFLTRAVQATRYLEPDADRRLPDRALMGDADIAALDTWDAGHAAQDGDARRTLVQSLEEATRAQAADLAVRSVSSFAWSGRSERASVASNGWESAWRSTSFGSGVTLSLEDAGGRLPEAWFMTSARHRADVVGVDTVAEQAVLHGRHRLGSGPAPSGRYPMLVENKLVGRVLGVLLGPMQGEALYEKRSCLEGRLGQRIANARLTLIDDPLIPRAAGSSPHDGDGLPSRRRVLVQDGVLQEFLIDVYNGRRLGQAPTGGDTGNLLVAPGASSPERLLAGLPRAIRVEGFLGGNTNPTSGDFSFGVHGVLLQGGVAVQHVSEMNISGNLFELLERYADAADDVWTWSAWRTPSLLFDDIQFSGS